MKSADELIFISCELNNEPSYKQAIFNTISAYIFFNAACLLQVLQDAGASQRRGCAAVHPVYSREHRTDSGLVPVGNGGVLIRLSCHRLLGTHHHC